MIGQYSLWIYFFQTTKAAQVDSSSVEKLKWPTFNYRYSPKSPNTHLLLKQATVNMVPPTTAMKPSLTDNDISNLVVLDGNSFRNLTNIPNTQMFCTEPIIVRTAIITPVNQNTNMRKKAAVEQFSVFSAVCCSKDQVKVYLTILSLSGFKWWISSCYSTLRLLWTNFNSTTNRNIIYRAIAVVNSLRFAAYKPTRPYTRCYIPDYYYTISYLDKQETLFNSR